MKRSTILSLLSAAAILALLARPRKPKAPPRWVPPAATDRLRLVSELKPLEARWTALDAKVASLKSGLAPEAERTDWPGLIREAMELVAQTAAVEQHFARDMGGLRGARDPVTGVAHAEFIERTYGTVDSLGRCTLGLSGLVALLHQMAEEPAPGLVRTYQRKSAEYQRLRAACVKGILPKS